MDMSKIPTFDLSKPLTKDEAIKYYLFNAIKGTGFVLIVYLGILIGTDAERPWEAPMFASIGFCGFTSFKLIEARLGLKPKPGDKLGRMQGKPGIWPLVCIIPTFMGFASPFVGLLPVAWLATTNLALKKEDAASDTPAE